MIWVDAENLDSRVWFGIFAQFGLLRKSISIRKRTRDVTPLKSHELTDVYRRLINIVIV